NSRRIISDLLDFTSAKPPMRRTVAPRELIEESIGRSAIPESVQLQADLPATLPTVNVDLHQIGQVLQSLITNAVQAMPDGGALRVAARRVSGFNSELKTQNSELYGDFVEISVEDTGEGISPENMKKLFQPLFTTRSRGIGLGLAISQKLTEANGGTIGVESRVGEGTTFTVALPAAKCKVQSAK
ncbi:MAG: ATP-binding protein, partial [Geobacteraceae bacterium]|nr:ATP-binding protein [Geobacteraceae bacterium]